MTVHTGVDVSIPYDVLMVRSDAYNIDSFFVNGSPDSTRVMDTLSITQGQRFERTHDINFYRIGDFKFLMRFTYVDSAHTNVPTVFVTTDNLTISGVNDTKAVTYTSAVYPNPSNAQEVNIRLSGKNVTKSTYTISDLQGRTIKHGNAVANGNNVVQVSLEDKLPAGRYLVKLTSGEEVLVNEQIEVFK